MDEPRIKCILKFWPDVSQALPPCTVQYITVYYSACVDKEDLLWQTYFPFAEISVGAYLRVNWEHSPSCHGSPALWHTQCKRVGSVIRIRIRMLSRSTQTEVNEHVCLQRRRSSFKTCCDASGGKLLRMTSVLTCYLPQVFTSIYVPGSSRGRITSRCASQTRYCLMLYERCHDFMINFQ